jgi:hypothetical protein
VSEREPSRKDALFGALFSLKMLLFLSAAITIVFEQSAGFASDPGVGWHLKTGQWIVEHKAVPTIDPFLGGSVRAWICDQWLSDAMLFYLYRAGSWSLIYLVLSAIYFFTYFGILLPLVERRSGTRAAAVLAVFFVMKIGFIHFLLRPTVFGFSFFAIELFLLEPLFTRSSSKKRLFWLPLLFVFWANMHGSFVLGAVPLAVGGGFYSWLLIRKKERAVTPFVVCALSFLATLVNPSGIGLHKSIVSLGGSKWLMQFYEEWLPLELTSFEGVLFLGIAACSVVGAWDIARKHAGDLKAGLSEWLPDVLLSAVFAVLAFRSVRISPYFGIASAVLVARGAHALAGTRVLRALFPSGIFQRVTAWIGEREAAYAMPRVQLLAGCVVLVSLAGYFAKDHSLAPPRGRYPYDAIAFLAKLPPGDVLAGPDLGGFLTLSLWPRNRPLMDDRGTLLGEAFFKQYFAARETPEGFVALARGLHATYVLLPAGSKLSSSIGPAGCGRLYGDEQAVVCQIN